MPTAPLLHSPEFGAHASSDCISIANVRSGIEDWSKICNLAPFWEMWNERRQALAQAALSVPAAGCDCQYMGLGDPASVTGDFSVATIQTWIESNATSFVRSHDSNGNAYAAGFHSGSSSIPMWTVSDVQSVSATWLNNLGQSPTKSSSGFTRLRFNGASAVGIADGTEGDYFYHPLWNEIYATMRLLAWTKHSAAFSNHAENNLRQSGAFTGSFTTWNGAYAAALAAFNGAAATSSVGFNPTAYEFGSDAGGGTEPNRYHCELLRFYYYGEFSSIPTHVSHAMDAYVFTAKTQTDAGNNVYFDHGDGPPYAQDVFKLHQTFAAANTATRTTTKIGSVTTAPTQGPTPNTVGGRFYGWEQWPSGGAAERSFPIGVARWNVAGGFSYT